MSDALAEQVAYLRERSPFYREKLAGHDLRDGLATLPLTTKQELRATVSPAAPMGTHTDEILTVLGRSREKIAELRAAGAIK